MSKAVVINNNLFHRVEFRLGEIFRAKVVKTEPDTKRRAVLSLSV